MAGAACPLEAYNFANSRIVRSFSIGEISVKEFKVSIAFSVSPVRDAICRWMRLWACFRLPWFRARR